MLATQNKKLLSILLLLLFSLYLMLVAIIFLSKTAFWSDEIIALDISKQNIHTLLDTIHSEPHPIGFYLTLKAINNYDPVINRITILTISYLLLFLAIIFAYKKNLLQKHNLFWGMALYILSFGSITLATNVKQDFISAPLFILIFFIVLEYIENTDVKTLIKLSLTIFATLFFGYLNFVKALFLLAIAIYFTKKKNAVTSLLILCFAFAGYIYLFGNSQIAENKDRFRFVKGSQINLINLINQSIAGPFNVKSNFYLPDVVFLIAIFLTSIFVISKKTQVEEFIFTSLIGFIIFDLLFSPLIRVRYMFEISFLILISAGIVLHKKLFEDDTKVTQSLMMLVFGMLFIFDSINFYYVNQSIKISEKQNKMINLLVNNSESPTGIIERHPDGAFIRKIWYFPSNNLAVPVDPFVQGFENYSYISRSLLNKEGSTSDEDIQKIYENLSSKNLKRFVYLDTSPTDNSEFYYDPNRKVPNVLNSVCKTTKILYFYNRLILIFENCDFTQPLDITDFHLDLQ